MTAGSLTMTNGAAALAPVDPEPESLDAPLLHLAREHAFESEPVIATASEARREAIQEEEAVEEIASSPEAPRNDEIKAEDVTESEPGAVIESEPVIATASEARREAIQEKETDVVSAHELVQIFGPLIEKFEEPVQEAVPTTEDISAIEDEQVIEYTPEPAETQEIEYKPVEEETTRDEKPSSGAMIEAAVSADDDVAGVMRMNDLRRFVAESTANSSRETAAVTQMMEMDITELFGLLYCINSTREKQAQISLTAVYLKTLAICIREKERFRMRLSKAKNAYLLMGGAHVGLQIGVGDGFVTPVIRDADVKSIEDISAEVIALKDKAKLGGFSERERRGAAITLLDKGDSGVYAFTPIIKQPESAILGIGAPYNRLIMTEKGIENRKFAIQSLTFDHRVIAGGEADDFQSMLKGILEAPEPVFG